MTHFEDTLLTLLKHSIFSGEERSDYSGDGGIHAERSDAFGQVADDLAYDVVSG